MSYRYQVRVANQEQTWEFESFDEAAQTVARRLRRATDEWEIVRSTGDPGANMDVLFGVGPPSDAHVSMHHYSSTT